MHLPQTSPVSECVSKFTKWGARNEIMCYLTIFLFIFDIESNNRKENFGKYIKLNKIFVYYAGAFKENNIINIVESTYIAEYVEYLTYGDTFKYLLICISVFYA